MGVPNNTIEQKSNYVVRENIATSKKLPASQGNEIINFQKKQGVNQGTFDPSNIEIVGSGSFDNYAHSTATLEMVGATGNSFSGDNKVHVKITFSIACTLSFSGTIDSTQLFGMPAGNIFDAGTYTFSFQYDPINSKIRVWNEKVAVTGGGGGGPNQFRVPISSNLGVTSKANGMRGDLTSLSMYALTGLDEDSTNIQARLDATPAIDWVDITKETLFADTVANLLTWVNANVGAGVEWQFRLLAVYQSGEYNDTEFLVQYE